MPDPPRSPWLPRSSRAVRRRRPVSAGPRRQLWRRQPSRMASLIGRPAKRVLAALLALVLVAILLALLIQPFRHPRSHLILLRGATQQLDPTVLASFRTQQPLLEADFAGLGPISRILDRQAAAAGIPQLIISGPSSILAFEDLVDDLSSESRDVVIVYTAARGLVHDGAPFLAFPAAKGAELPNRIKMDQLLGQLSHSSAGVTLLIINTPVPGTDLAGRVMNEFPHLVQRAVAATGDRALWVLLSHTIGEASHAAPAQRRSVFGMFVSRGLQGAADLDHDQTIRVDELFRYVSPHVSDRVREMTAESVGQHPQLLWGGGSVKQSVAASQILVPVLPEATRAGRTTPAGEKKIPEVEKSGSTMAAARPAVPASLPASRVTPTVPSAPRLPTATVPTVPKGPVLATGAQVPQLAQATTSPSAAPTGSSGQAISPEATPQESAPTEAPATPDQSPKADENGAEGNTDKSQSKTGAKTSPPAKTPSESETEKTSSPRSSSPRKVDQLIATAWRLRDELARGKGRPGPIAYAPHQWRLFQEEMITLERLARATLPAKDEASPEQTVLRAAWQHIVKSLAALQRPGQSLPPLAPQILRRISAARPQTPVNPAQLHSLAMAERLDVSLPPKFRQAVQKFDALLQSGSRQQFTAWLKDLASPWRRLAEFQLVTALLDLEEADWPTLRLALQVRRLAERTAAHPLASVPPYRSRVARADRFRRSGERTLLDQIDPDRGAEARQELHRAARLYQEALVDMRDMEAITRLQRRLSFRARWSLRWFRLAGRTTAAPEFRELLTLFESLQRLTAELAKGNQRDLATLRRLVSQLTDQQHLVASARDRPVIESLLSPPILRSDGWRVESLLATPLPGSSTRIRLLQQAPAIHTAAAAQFQQPKVPAFVPFRQPLSSGDWRRLKQLARLERELLELALIPLPKHDDLLEEVRDTSDQANMVLDSLVSGARFDGAAALQALDDFERAMQEASHQAIAKHLQADRPVVGTSDAAMSERMGQLQRMLHLVRVRGMTRPNSATRETLGTAASRLQRLRWLRLALWQRARLRAAREDASPARLKRLAASSRGYENLAESLAKETLRFHRDPITIDVSGSSSLTLVRRDRAEVELTLDAATADAVPAWVILDYDPQRLRVTPTGHAIVYREETLREKLRQRVLSEPALTRRPQGARGTQQDAGSTWRAAEYPLRPDLASLPPTLTIPTEPTRFSLDLERVPGATGPTRLIVKLLAEGHVVRHEIAVTLPWNHRLEVHLAGTPGSWSRQSGLLTLHPFPNRVSDYSLNLVNAGSQPRTVSVALFALEGPSLPSLPRGNFSTTTVAKILDEFQLDAPLMAISKLALPATGTPVALHFPKMPQKGADAAKPVANPGSESAAPQGETAGAKAPATLASVSDGMLLLVRDKEAGRALLQPIAVMPQRPQRFLEVEAAYAGPQQRVEMTVRPRGDDPALLPPGGVPLRLEFAQPLPPGTEQQLEGRLTATSGPIQLFALVPARPGRVATIFLHVNGFPRAFSYRVPCNTRALVEAEELEELAVRMTSPAAGLSYGTPRESIPVTLQVDAPHLGSGRPDVFVEVGIDADQDGEFRGESPVRLDSDRQVEVALAPTTPEGGVSFSIATRVDDFTVAVPTWGVTNRHVNLLARVVADGTSVWSRELAIVLDGLSPRIDRIRLNPAAGVGVGKPVTVLVEASDTGLSGVERVEVAFDVARTGQFAKKPPPVPAQRTDTGAWRAVLATKPLQPGRNAVLVRAIDRVGHVSETASARIPILTAEQAAAMKKAAIQTRITGVVLFRGQPAPGVTVRLVATPDKEDKAKDKQLPTFPPQQAKKGGAFAFSAVPPGKYTLSASGLLRNENRTTSIPITVAGDPKPWTDVKIELE